ncbi:MAG: hypothetical protein QXN68_00420 [Thermoplasmata archaeon]
MRTTFKFDGYIPKYEVASRHHARYAQEIEELFYKELLRSAGGKFIPDPGELTVFRKLSAFITRVFTIEYPVSLIKSLEKFSDNIAKSYQKNLRSRLMKAPYNFKSSKPGPWSRHGGTPSAYSLRAYVKDTEIKSRSIWVKEVRIEVNPSNKPSIIFPYTRPPWQYLMYKRGGLVHLYLARVQVMRQYMLKALAAYSKHYGRRAAKIIIKTR